MGCDLTITLDSREALLRGFRRKGSAVSDFWEDKDPCWKLLGCSKYVFPLCPAYHQRHKPCWECASTECKRMLNLKVECRDCKVFKTYGPSEK